MAVEIERKFLVSSDAWRAGAEPGTRLRQGYLSTDPDRNVRVRIKGEKALLTVKGRLGEGTVSRLEYEYEIPMADAEAMLGLCLASPIDKTRYEIPHGGHLFELDEFHGRNAGLLIAEIELESESAHFEKPPWLGREVSDDPRYLNANLVESPFDTW
ncbi:MAG: CYTH domain-containing protein [Acidobacteriota bacterium]